MTNEPQKIRIALIYGGSSGEHPISCATAGAVMASLDSQRYDVVSIAIRKDGTWVPGETDPEKLQLNSASTEVPPSDERVVLAPGDGSQELMVVAADSGEVVRSLGAVDVVFPLLHGAFGEDGTIQGLLEMANIPYVGCGVFASAAGMDKGFMKVVLESAGIPVGPYVVANRRRWSTQRAAVIDDVSKLQFPVFVKPARAGSSLGISRVDTLDELEIAVERAHEVDPKVVIEQGISGREIECAVLGGHGDEPTRAAMLGEVVLSQQDAAFYDFEHKYVDTAGLRMQVPAEVDAHTTERMREMAVRTFDAFECEGLTRVDFFLTNDGDILINEINTMPGFTPFSMYPVMWEEAGLSYAELVDELISLALERGTGLH
ncbi:D-alanine--D-alanine ligase family protein [Arcanobacterium bovis]|uniref:D-alanine--D-alanine ligase n=1 Tax=Arcanobacterium bovis TaxID=2529275 RepID=A0A4Q9V0B5_9ACTO|nr:D-alanine--D-alanine ligase family protein [Arcanobacterium bovis]TBW22068.1 D-alanine--D-alanine ligase [Arcanobacterium bovis]